MPSANRASFRETRLETADNDQGTGRYRTPSPRSVASAGATAATPAARAHTCSSNRRAMERTGRAGTLRHVNRQLSFKRGVRNVVDRSDPRGERRNRRLDVMGDDGARLKAACESAGLDDAPCVERDLAPGRPRANGAHLRKVRDAMNLVRCVEPVGRMRVGQEMARPTHARGSLQHRGYRSLRALMGGERKAGDVEDHSM